MIKRFMLLEQAKRFRLGNSGPYAGKDKDDIIIKEYIEKRIKAVIHIPFEKMETYYLDNMKRFGDRGFYEAKDEIEDIMIKKELEKKLSEHIHELRKRAYIRIQLEE